MGAYRFPTAALAMIAVAAIAPFVLKRSKTVRPVPAVYHDQPAVPDSLNQRRSDDWRFFDQDSDPGILLIPYSSTSVEPWTRGQRSTQPSRRDGVLEITPRDYGK